MEIRAGRAEGALLSDPPAMQTVGHTPHYDTPVSISTAGYICHLMFQKFQSPKVN